VQRYPSAASEAELPIEISVGRIQAGAWMAWEANTRLSPDESRRVAI
jgi:hypothetical protein